MSIDQYRTQVANIQNSIAKLHGEKAKKINAAAKAGKKNHDALAAAASTLYCQVLEVRNAISGVMAIVGPQSSWMAICCHTTILPHQLACAPRE